jgi:hypothetical protein
MILIGHGGGYHFTDVGDGRQVDHALDVEVGGVVVLLDHGLAGAGLASSARANEDIPTNARISRAFMGNDLDGFKLIE